jgi:hypothetical protein
MIHVGLSALVAVGQCAHCCPLTLAVTHLLRRVVVSLVMCAGVPLDNSFLSLAGAMASNAVHVVQTLTSFVCTVYKPYSYRI